MSISERIVWVALCVGAPLLAWSCEVPGQCLRYSDCDQGLTCAAGRCVVPPVTDASAETDAAPEPDALSSSAVDGGASRDAAATDALEALDSAVAEEGNAGALDAAPGAPPDAASDSADDATAD